MDAFEALADPVRRGLLATVAIAPARVVDLAASQPISRPAVSRHLRLLNEAGLVDVEDRGRERHYVLRASSLQPIREWLDQLAHAAVHPVTSGALDALDTEVRRTSRERRRATRQPATARKDSA
jgi:DNA-binding transcriptional ArsR family regulator